MKRDQRAKLIALMDEFVEWVDEVHPKHEWHSERLALFMASAAQAVYDSTQQGQRDARRYGQDEEQ